MPDWTYRTVFRPILALLPFVQARRLALGSMGILAHTAVGRQIIQWMGHMAPPVELETTWHDVKLRSPIGISSRLDPERQAIQAWNEFGVGLIELGPIGVPSESSSDAGLDQTTINLDQNLFRTVERTITPEDCLQYLPRRSESVLFLTRLRLGRDNSMFSDAIGRLNDRGLPTQAISLEWPDEVPIAHRIDQANQILANSPSVQFLLVTCSVGQFSEIIETTRAIRVAQDDRMGILVDFAVAVSINESESMSQIPCVEIRECRKEDLALVAEIRKELGPERLVATRSGVRQPIDAVALIQSGVNFQLVDDGMIFSGPGLIKRIHNAVRLLRKDQNFPQRSPITSIGSNQNIPAWSWAMILAAAMFFGGLITLWVSCRGVMLPYDEVYLQMSAESLQSLSPSLMSFMAHDRVTLAGTMLGLGIFYGGLGFFGLRRGMHWSQMVIWCSTLVGFLSFFSFLFFGYFDSLHGFVSAVLISVAFQMVQSRLGTDDSCGTACLRDDRPWRFAQWGQLLLVLQGISLIVAGATITIIASTFVFVAEDLAFLKLTVEEIHALHPRLVSVVAHDRATFGGMLLSSGVATLFAAMWGVDRGRAWLWWSWFLGGSIAYGATLIVHACVGYTDWRHLLPAALGLCELWLALAFLLPYLCYATTEESKEIA